MASEIAIIIVYFVAKGCLCGHGSCRYQLAQRCPTVAVFIVFHVFHILVIFDLRSVFPQC